VTLSVLFLFKQLDIEMWGRFRIFACWAGYLPVGSSVSGLFLSSFHCAKWDCQFLMEFFVSDICFTNTFWTTSFGN